MISILVLACRMYVCTACPPTFLARLSRRLIGELIVYRSSRHASVHTFNMNISATSWLFGMKFYLKHHWGGGKASICFDPDLFRTLVSMATDSSHRVIMGKTASSRFLECFWSDPFHSSLQVTMTCMRAWMSLKFGRIWPGTTELAALERMKKIP